MKTPVGRLLVIVSMVAALSACAAIPTSGPVQRGSSVGVDPNDQVIRVIARPPSPGMTPQEVVQGFLDASASFEGDHQVARLYLTSDASSLWHPTEQIEVYDGIVQLQSPKEELVQATVQSIASIDSQGVFQTTTPTRKKPFGFELAKQDGEWRIASPPYGLLLSQFDVDRSFRTYNLYFFDQGFGTLVPDPRTFPLQENGMATTLVRELIDGPSGWLAPAVRTAVPDGVELAIDAVPVDYGTARVELSQQAVLLDEKSRRALSAQIGWTLRQVVGLNDVDLRAGGQPLTVSGVPSPQPVSAWMALNPDAPPASDAVYALSSGRAISVSATGTLLLPGGAGSGQVALSAIGLSAGATQIAAVDQDGTLWRGDVMQAADLYQALAEPGLSQPQFDRAGNIWALGSQGLPRVVTPSNNAMTVRLEGFSAGSVIVDLALAPDDSRAALIVQRGPRRVLMLARVMVTDAAVTISGPRRIESLLTDVRSVGWSSSVDIAALAASGVGDPHVFIVNIGHGIARDQGAPSTTVSMAAAPGEPIVVTTSANRLYTLIAGSWAAGAYGSKPVYSR